MLRLKNCRFVNLALMVFGIQRTLYVEKVRRFPFAARHASRRRPLKNSVSIASRGARSQGSPPQKLQ